MKNAFLVLLTIFAQFLYGQSQPITSTLAKMQVMYIGVENPMTINGIDDLSNCTATSSWPGIKFAIKENQIIAIPSRATNRKGTDIFLLNSKGDTVLTHHVRIKRLPTPSPSFLGQKNGLISIGKLKIGRKLNARIEHFDFKIDAEVTSFLVTIVSKNGSPKSYKCVGNELSADVKDAFFKVKKGDLILFCEIKVKILPRSTYLVSPLILKAK